MDTDVLVLNCILLSLREAGIRSANRGATNSVGLSPWPSHNSPALLEQLIRMFMYILLYDTSYNYDLSGDLDRSLSWGGLWREREYLS